ncbi:hypothetical protein RHECNPAF_1340098 [Rhizobium etli CNPAF512]|nr:hypothetical protein RHECNPAF_1340098 [Rhizobium etli CNPAF512]
MSRVANLCLIEPLLLRRKKDIIPRSRSLSGYNGLNFCNEYSVIFKLY